MEFENLAQSTAQLPDIEEVEFNAHPRRYKKLRVISISLFFLVLAVGVGILFFFKDLMFTLPFIIGWLLLYAFALLAEHKGFKIRGYALRERDISYRKGWIWYNLTTVPFNRIQHCEISQGPLGRIFKLSQLKVYTAGGSSSDLFIGGLDPEQAKKLREFIINKAGLDE
jgi:membrane protein YdbS with pleckstrin-like domain